MKKIYFLLVSLLISLFATAQQFIPDSSQTYYVNSITNSSSNITAFDDGNSGAYLMWLDARSGNGKTAIYFQHLNKYGAPQYPQNGKKLLSASSNTISGYKAIKTQNGFVVAWNLNTAVYPDSLFCNYFSFNGTALWSQATLVSSRSVTMISVTNNGLNIMPSDSGFFINYSSVYFGGSEGFGFNRIDFNGNLRWPINHFQPSSNGYYWTSVSDKHNGFFYAVTTGGIGAHIYVQHYNALGLKSFPNEVDISTLAGGRGNSAMKLTCDEDTNLYVTWESSINTDIVLAKITARGTLPWIPNFRSMSNVAASKTTPAILYFKNNIYTTWSDGRPPAFFYHVYAQKTDLNGNNQWTLNGDSIFQLGSYSPSPRSIANAANELVMVANMAPGFLAQLKDTAGALKWIANGRNIHIPNDVPFYDDYALVAAADSAVACFWVTSGGKVCASKMSRQGKLFNQYPLPSSAGVISGNDTICAGSTGQVYTVAPITNATQYIWNLPSGLMSASGSDTTQTPSITVNFDPSILAATIKVWGNNSLGDGAASADFNIILKPLPAAAGSISGLDSAAACTLQNGINYSIAPLANADFYSWTLPPLASINGNPDSNAVSINFSPYTTSGNIIVSGYNDCGAGISAALPIYFKPIPTAQICFSTVDSATQKVLLFWEQPIETYAHNYVIYRETAGVFLPIDTTIHPALAGYLDTSSHPNLHPEKYKIAVLDSCGNVGELSAVSENKCIYLYGFLGWANIPKLYWTDYIGASDTSRLYRVLVDTTGSGPFSILADSLPATQLNFTDYISPLNCVTCRYVIETVFRNFCNPDARAMVAITTSRSNIKNKNEIPYDSLVFGIKNKLPLQNSFSIYPNPAKEKITIGNLSANNAYQISLYNAIGQCVINAYESGKNNCEISIQDLQSGLYLIKISSEEQRKVIKIQVE
ncbi:MAG: T9SS type A sorting domain-containing protein [Bacteroidetes bacterium]|nr:T9SS type A sorting domain-containing protein [Bacteroidota bacterium]